MILVMSGTSEGREIIKLLKTKGFRVMATAVTPYGSKLSKEAGADVVLTGALDRTGLTELIRENGIHAVVDATHPFATEASKNAMAACREAGKAYLRFERESSALPDNPRIHYSKDFKEAGVEASKHGDNIFYTAGIKGLPKFLEVLKDKTVVVRTIPDRETIERCLELGINPGNIIAMQGPFSKEFNLALFKEFKAEVIVTKESGQAGGTDTKVDAARELQLPIIVINRPEITYKNVVHDLLEVVEWISRKP
jgi:precorrin-6A/cobalt-precorrin-6A reductase